MINTNYALMVEQARANNETRVNFDNDIPAVQPIPSQKDTVTLSDKALAMMNGLSINEDAPTYVKPESARALIAKHDTENSSINSQAVKNEELKNNSSSKSADIDTRFADMMQKILDRRLGVDRDKLEELDAMMKEVADNENMSPEEKELALEKIAEMREEIIEKAQDMRDFAKEDEEIN
jgi:hypothetical protein